VQLNRANKISLLRMLHQFFPVVKAHVDELSSARIWQHKLYATLPPNVNINCRLSHDVAKNMSIWRGIVRWMQSLKTVLRQIKSDLLRQMTSWMRFSWHEIFYDRTRKGWAFNTSDCLIEVTSWADLTVLWKLAVDICIQDSYE
jgi:hypothetical protein